MFYEILSTIFIAMLPVSELRGAIPVAIGVYDFEPAKAAVLAVIGNMIPVFLLLWFLPKFAKILMERSRTAERFLGWLFERTRRKTERQIKKYGIIALALFVAIPLPLTGAWTGAVAAFLFGISYWKAIAAIFVGVLIAAAAVTLGTIGALRIVWR